MTKTSSSAVCCPACGKAATGKFCNHCGASLTPAPVVEEAPASSFSPWMVLAAVAIAVVAFVGGRLSMQGSTPSGSGAPLAADASPTGGAPFAGGGGNGAAPDISSMSPRERAARLYDRIMRYEEEKKPDSVQVFAPMAMAAYEMLGAEFDIDARYDYGRIAAAAGKYDIARAEADTMLSKFPNHLLALALRARTATSEGKNAEASKVWKQFLAVKDEELKKNYPEYQNHAGDITAAASRAAGK